MLRTTGFVTPQLTSISDPKNDTYVNKLAHNYRKIIPGQLAI